MKPKFKPDWTPTETHRVRLMLVVVTLWLLGLATVILLGFR